MHKNLSSLCLCHIGLGPLAKSNHMVTPRFEGWRKRLHLLMRREETVATFFAIYTNDKIRCYLALGFRQHLSFQQGWESEVLLPERARSLISQSVESSKSGEAKRGMRHIPLASWDNRAGWQKQLTVNEVQNQRRPSAVCGGNGPHSKYNEITYSFPLKFFFILLYFA